MNKQHPISNASSKCLLLINATDRVGQYIINKVIKSNKVIFTGHPQHSHEADKIIIAAKAEGLENNIKFIPADISLEANAEVLIDSVMQEFDQLDGVMINTKINFELPLSPLHELSLAEWEFMLNESMHPVFFLNRRILEELLIQGHGRLLQMAGAQEAVTQHGIYDTIQSALYSFYRSIAKEYGRRNIICNAIAPIYADQNSDYLSSLAELAIFLLADSTSFVTGEIFSPKKLKGLYR